VSGLKGIRKNLALERGGSVLEYQAFDSPVTPLTFNHKYEVMSREFIDRSFLNFVENTVVHERNLPGKWVTHRA
jgi:hypothetical protein